MIFGNLDIPIYIIIACSQTLYFLLKVRRARVIIIKTAGDLLITSARGVGVEEEENRRSVDIFGSNQNLLFPGKANYNLAERQSSCHYHVNDSSRSRHVSRSVCRRLDALTAFFLSLFFFSRSALVLVRSLMFSGFRKERITKRKI